MSFGPGQGTAIEADTQRLRDLPLVETDLEKRGVQILRKYCASLLPDISVVVPMFNTERWIAAAVRSALAQVPVQVEVVVIDDGSLDGGLQRVLGLKDDRLTIVTQPNRGLSAARNTGILLALAPIIGFLDGDDVWFPEKARRHLEVLEMAPEVGLTFSWSAYLNENGDTTGQYLTSQCPSPSARDLTRRNHVGNGSTPIVRRSCFDAAGLFDEEMNSCEDLEMWIRIVGETPFTLRLVPALLTGYRVRDGSLSVNFEGFIRAAERLKQRICVRYNGLSVREARRCLGQLLRIASRKALAHGQVQMSRNLLHRAAREDVWSVLGDPRGIALATIHFATICVPERSAFRCYNFVSKLSGALVGRIFGLKRPANRGLTI